MSNSKLFKCISVISLLLIISLILSFNSFAIQKNYTLKLADTTAPVGMRGEHLNLLLEEIEKHTDGRINMEVYWGSSLLTGKEILTGIRDKVVDCGFVLPEYYSKEMPIHSIFAVIPQGPTDFQIARKLYFDIFEQVPGYTEELESYNQKLFYIGMQQPMTVVCTKPFTSFEDFKGKKIRASSRWYLDMLDGAGANPVSVPWEDLYMALQTGTIEGVCTNIDGEHRTKLDEVAPNVFTMREIWMGTPLMYTINLDVWNQLPTDLQDALMAASEAAMERFAEVHANEWDRIIDEQIEAGYVVTHASEEDIENWTSMPKVAELEQEWVKEVEDRGVSNAEEILNQTKDLVHKALQK